MQKIVLIAVLMFMSVSISAQQYKVNNIEYDITGNITGTTQVYPLRNAVEIDTEQVFNTREAFDAYIMDLTVQFQNQRVFDSAHIYPTYGTEGSDGIVPVDLLIETVDTFNVIALPYPKYDSNYGLELKLAVNHYNFLGSMLPLDFDIKYNYDTEDGENDHILGLYTSFTLPFQIGILDAKWGNTLSASYTIGNTLPEANYSTSFSLTHEFNDIVSLSASLSQGVTYNPDYEQYNDAFYLTEGASLSMPVTLAKTENIGNLVWTPSVSINYYWDPLDLIIDFNNEDLIDTNITYQHSISLGRTNWIGNFKDGFNFSLTQKLIQESYKQKFLISGELNVEYSKAYEHFGLKSRAYLFSMSNDTSELGGRLRGIQNDDVDTNSALVVNLDFPIKVWQTDWVGYGLWDWTKYFDFEMQISPFFDFAIGYNALAQSTNNPKDGWYGAGLEVTGYLNAARSVVGRISFGVDVIQFADKVGDKVSFIDTAVHSIFNTAWRKDNWYEFSFGIGLLY